MKKILSFCIIVATFFLGFLIHSENAIAACSWWTLGFGCPTASQIEYCQDGKCTIKWGEEAVKIAIGTTFTDKPLSVFITDVVRYFLSFVTIVAVIYIIFAGFQLMTWGGDEEKTKKARQIIIYVIAGIVLMWVSYWIVRIVLDALK
jgi:Type IV secretion system pilin